MDIQLAFRNGSSKLHAYSVYMSCGFVRARVGALEAERVCHFHTRLEGDDLKQVTPSGLVSTLDLSDRERLSSGMGDLLRHTAWRLPVTEGLSLFLRRSRVDAQLDDHEVFSVVGMLLVDPSRRIDEDTIHAFAGSGIGFARPDLSRRPEGGLIELVRGMNWDSVLKQPIWGFTEDPVGLWSTLELGVCDLLDRYNALNDMGGEGVETAEFADIKAQLWDLGLPGPGRTDDVYRHVREQLAENHPDLVRRPSGDPRSKIEIEAMQSTMAQAVRAALVATRPGLR
jgi:hypothetical protein